MKSALLLLSFILFTHFSWAQSDANAILEKMDATLAKVKDKSADVQMTLKNLKSGKTKVKKAVLYQKGADKKLFRYTFPAGDSGIATLSLPDETIYMYLPMFKKPKKVTNLAESNTFNNSDFSISDMANQAYAKAYQPELVSSNARNYRLKLIPKSENNPYGFLLVDIHKTAYYHERIEYYRKSGEMQKFAVYHHIKVNGVWVADEIAMEDVKKKHKTTLKLTNLKVNKGLSDDLFTLENLAPSNQE